MLPSRSQDTQLTREFPRTDRLLISDRGLFYKTREGVLRGPFISESSALFDLNIHIQVSAIEQELQ